jgi:hypothetical protein
MSFSSKKIIAKIGVGATIAAFALGLNYMYAWVEPAATPPSSNATAPLNVGTVDQVKNAGLSLDRLSVIQNATVGGSLGVGVVTPAAGMKVEVQGGPIKATGGLIIETRTSDPGSPSNGQMWLRTDI